MRTLLTLSALAGLALAGCRVADERPGGRSGGPELPAGWVATDVPGVARADSLVDAWVREERVPGAVLLVSRGDRVLARKAYGFAQLNDFGSGQYRTFPRPGNGPAAVDDRPPASAPHPDASTGEGGLRRLDEPRPMTERTVFDLASVTKVAATTMAVMLLADRGLLDVDRPAADYLPDFRGGGKERITLRHLLTHRSGLYQWRPVYYHAADPDEAYAYVRDLPLAWPVGEGRHYSDLGFMLLGRIVERVDGRRLGHFLREELYDPLGLEAIGFRGRNGRASDRFRGLSFAATSHGNPFEHRMVHDSTFGYLYDGDPFSWDGWRRYTLVGEVNDGNAHHAFGGEAGHAGLFAGADELRVLVRLLLDDGLHEGRRILSADVVEAFLRPQTEGQALGWQVPEWAPPGSFSHTGFTGTFVLGVPAENLTVVLLTNRQNVGVDDETRLPDVGPLQRGVAAAILDSDRP